MTAPGEIIELVERFDRNRDAYRSPSYNETQLRREFLDPFFTALGWDIDNRAGWAEAYKEVIHEDAIKIGGFTKAPDYCFRVGGNRKFFVEAKKPAVDIRQDTSPAFQLRRYAWSAKLPLSVLTDFEEFAVYDCRIKPSAADKASAGRIRYFTYAEYSEKWGEIASVFSKDAVLKGSFDKYAETTRSRRGTAEVDAAFLQEIETWRDLLARNLAIRNPRLSQRELNFGVQRTIDRIIFLRICEDRGIEPEGRLLGLTNAPGIYGRLLELYRKADERYNSGLFHFRQEKGRAEEFDRLTPGLTIEDKVLKDILKNLYYPDSPYEFSVLPADILGQVYEQFLGKVIRLTAGHQAKVEDKPEVKKAGGVFYTPTFIVEYIVRNTVGRLLEGKTPKEAEKITILDPACGSGSFLLGAYQLLLDWHRDWYVNHGKEKFATGKRPALYQGMGWEWRLTTAERKRILTNNIFGVDIDPQAVETTKLSLLLKVLEGESEQTLSSQFKLFHERALPDLGGNIKCGNSLIGSDFYQGASGVLPMFGEEERLRINVFDWEKEFPRIFSGDNPGFDVVIGNPPYIRIQALKEWAPLEVEFYKKRYVSAGKGNYDIYVVFVEKGLSLLNGKGRLGYILPHKFFNAQYGEPLRGLISKGKHLAEVVHFGDRQVFNGATTYTCLMFLDKAGAEACKFEKVENLDAWRAARLVNVLDPEPTIPASIVGGIPTNTIGPTEWNFTVGEGALLFEKLREMPVKLGDMADIFVGLQTSADDVFIMDLVKDLGSTLRLRSKSLDSEWDIEKGIVFPLVSGTDVKRYSVLPERQYVLFPYRLDRGSATLIEYESLSKSYPNGASYLSRNKHRLEDRERGRFKDNNWHRFGRNQNVGIQDREKLCVPRLVTQLFAAYDVKGTHFLDNVDVGGITLVDKYRKQGFPYLLGLLNSKLLGWYFPFVSAPFRGGWRSANRQFLSQLPIRTINFSERADKARHDRMVALVESMLSRNKQLAAANTGHEKTALQRQIDATDRQIDQLVYELYGLTDDEISIVEGAAGPRK
ncbi:Eco57I restriction-modification methylase domain-containing protein [bacterium]|nr:Eco57I restriction-modification methylase domain-containing protein [bacterium]